MSGPITNKKRKTEKPDGSIEQDPGGRETSGQVAEALTGRYSGMSFKLTRDNYSMVAFGFLMRDLEAADRVAAGLNELGGPREWKTQGIASIDRESEEWKAFVFLSDTDVSVGLRTGSLVNTLPKGQDIDKKLVERVEWDGESFIPQWTLVMW